MAGHAFRGVEYATQAERDLSRKLYYDDEGNCNTCRHLVRVKHEKQADGFLHGLCGRLVHLQLVNNGKIAFHPEDPLHLPCYESRY